MDRDSRSWEGPFRIAQILTIAMLGSLGLYAVLVQVFSANAPAAAPAVAEDPSLFRYLFYGLALSSLVAVRFLRGLVLSSGGQSRPAAQRLLTAQVLTAALIESAGVLGLVLFFLTRLKLDAFVLIGLAVVLMVLYFPRSDAWESYIREQERR